MIREQRVRSRNIECYASHMGYKEGIGVIEGMTSFVLQGNEWDPAIARFRSMNQRHSKSHGRFASSSAKKSTADILNEQGPTLITCDRHAIHSGTWSIRNAMTGKLLKRCGEGVHKAAILAVTYIPCMEYIVTSSADLTLDFGTCVGTIYASSCL